MAVLVGEAVGLGVFVAVDAGEGARVGVFVAVCVAEAIGVGTGVSVAVGEEVGVFSDSDGNNATAWFGGGTGGICTDGIEIGLSSAFSAAWSAGGFSVEKATPG